MEVESCTEQGSYQSEIKDGGNQTSTCAKQSLTGIEKQASGSLDLRLDENVRRKARTLTGGKHSMGEGEGDPRYESSLPV